MRKFVDHDPIVIGFIDEKERTCVAKIETNSFVDPDERSELGRIFGQLIFDHVFPLAALSSEGARIAYTPIFSGALIITVDIHLDRVGFYDERFQAAMKKVVEELVIYIWENHRAKAISMVTRQVSSYEKGDPREYQQYFKERGLTFSFERSRDECLELDKKE